MFSRSLCNSILTILNISQELHLICQPVLRLWLLHCSLFLGVGDATLEVKVTVTKGISFDFGNVKDVNVMLFHVIWAVSNSVCWTFSRLADAWNTLRSLSQQLAEPSFEAGFGDAATLLRCPAWRLAESALERIGTVNCDGINMIQYDSIIS